MRKLTVREYANLVGLSTQAIRNKIDNKKLPITKELVNGREITLIVVEDDWQVGNQVEHTLPIEKIYDYQVIDNVDNKHQEPEIMSTSTDLISMKETAFENLLLNLRELAESSLATERESYKRLEKEYFELKAKVATCEETIQKFQNQLFSEKLKCAQAESDCKIKDLRIAELEKINQEVEKTSKETEKTNKDLEERVKTSEQKKSGWFNKL